MALFGKNRVRLRMLLRVALLKYTNSLPKTHLTPHARPLGIVLRTGGWIAMIVVQEKTMPIIDLSNNFFLQTCAWYAHRVSIHRKFRFNADVFTTLGTTKKKNWMENGGNNTCAGIFVSAESFFSSSKLPIDGAAGFSSRRTHWIFYMKLLYSTQPYVVVS